jgi:SAM-dependent methyltransferase
MASRSGRTSVARSSSRRTAAEAVESSDSEQMPPLLSAEEETELDSRESRAPLMAATAKAAAAFDIAAASPAGWLPFGPASVRCRDTAYSCCLRYNLKLATCCMPSPSALPNIPSFEWLQDRFYPLDADSATLTFLHECDRNYFTYGWLSWWGVRIAFLKPLLRRCMAHTDVNGLLRCGRMFLTSRQQVQAVLNQSIPDCIRGKAGVEWPWSVPADSHSRSSAYPARLLDIGAGDGHITAQFADFFKGGVVATEVSQQMVARLRARGFTTVHTGDLDEGLELSSDIVGEGFDLVALFNVLDRCAKPRTLLRQILARMRKPHTVAGVDGLVNSSRLILSVPLPLDPSVEEGTRWVDPLERILPRGQNPRDFESASCALANMLLEEGFDIESFSRLPYLSQGDSVRPFYVLDCSLWVLSARGDNLLPKRDTSAESSKSQGRNGHHAHGVSAKLPTSILDLTSEVD